MPVDGEYRVRVEGAGSDFGFPYDLYLYRIDTLPEHSPSVITPGDSIGDERIDLPGDIDDFFLTVAGGDGLSFQAWKAAGEGASLVAVLRHAAADTASLGGGFAFTLDSLGDSVSSSGTFVTPPGTYLLSIQQGGASWPAISYRVKSNLIRFDPEGVAPGHRARPGCPRIDRPDR